MHDRGRRRRDRHATTHPSAESDQRIGDLRSVIDDADAAVANLEVVLPERDAAATPLPPVPSQYQYLSPLAGILMRAEPFVLDELDAFGFDLFATASNHSFDYGRHGMRSTMDALRERELPFAGMGSRSQTPADPRTSTPPAAESGWWPRTPVSHRGARPAPPRQTTQGERGSTPPPPLDTRGVRRRARPSPRVADGTRPRRPPRDVAGSRGPRLEGASLRAVPPCVLRGGRRRSAAECPVRAPRGRATGVPRFGRGRGGASGLRDREPARASGARRRAEHR